MKDDLLLRSRGNWCWRVEREVRIRSRIGLKGGTWYLFYTPLLHPPSAIAFDPGTVDARPES